MLLKLILLDRGTDIIESSQTDDIGNSGVLRLKQLSVKYGRDHYEVICYLLRLADEIIAAARNCILVKSDVDILTAHRHLDELMSAASLYGPKTLLDDISLAVHILHGLGHSRCMNWMPAIKSLNAAINFSARLDGDHRPGLSEALILLSEAYSKLGAEKEMIHSAKLAVNYAHKRLTVNSSDPGSDISIQIETTISAISHVEERDRNCHPLLHKFPALLASYYNLAVVLESSGPAAESVAMGWYLRVISAASKMQGAESRVWAESAEVAQRHNSDDVMVQIQELKQFASNAISRLEQSPTQLTIDTAYNDASAGSNSQNALQSRRSVMHAQGVGGMRPDQYPDIMEGEFTAAALTEDHGQGDSASSAISAKAISSSSISRLYTQSYDTCGSRKEDLYLAVDTDTGGTGGRNRSGQPTVKQSKAAPTANAMPSPRSLEIEVDSRQRPPSPVSRSRPQSAQPRLLSDAAAAAVLKPVKWTPSVTPISTSGPQSSSESTRRGPCSTDSVRGVRLLSTLTLSGSDSNQEAVAAARQRQRRREQQVCIDSLQQPSSSSVNDSAFFSEAEYEQQQYDLTMAALSSRDHFLFLPPSAEETLSIKSNTDISSNSYSNSNVISMSERSSPLDRDRVSAYSMALTTTAQEIETKIAHNTPLSSSGRGASDPRKSNKANHKEPKKLSRTQSDLSYVGIKTAAVPLRDGRRKSDAFVSPVKGSAGTVAKQQQDASSHKKKAVEEKQGKATRLRQETLAVRSRAALTMQRVARGFLARSSSRTPIRLRGNGLSTDTNTARDRDASTSTVLASDGEQNRIVSTSVSGAGTGSTKDVVRSRRGSSDSTPSKEVVSVSSSSSSKGTPVPIGVVRSGRGSMDALTPTSTSSSRRPSLSNHEAELKLSLHVGSKIEGRYMAMRLGKKSSWLPGKVSKVLANGSYNLLYNNGTKEFGVRAEHIRVKASEAMSVAGSAVTGLNRSALGSDSQTECIQQHLSELTITQGVQESSAVMLQKIARGYLERKRHKGLLLQIKRCMDLRMREKEVIRREARVWDRFEGIVTKAREDVARSLKSLNVPELIKAVPVVSRKNSNTTPATQGTGSSFSPSTLESPSHMTSFAHEIHEPRMEAHLASTLDMDESHLFSMSDSDEQVAGSPLEKQLIGAIDEMEMEVEGGESGEECGEVEGVRNEIGDGDG